MNVGSLFSGIGGFDRGFQEAGFQSIWQIEWSAFCAARLARHFPGAHLLGDVQEARGLPYVDVLCGGFPCPAVSQAARGRNNAPWLWPEFARVLREVRPRYVVVENVPGLLYRDRSERFGEILGDLAELGFDASWRVLRASDFGAPHHRARVWLVGYPHRDGQPGLSLDDEAFRLPQLRESVWSWTDRPSCLGVVDGLPDRVDRVKALGNALVPQIAEWIGRRILEFEESHKSAVGVGAKEEAAA